MKPIHVPSKSLTVHNDPGFFPSKISNAPESHEQSKTREKRMEILKQTNPSTGYGVMSINALLAKNQHATPSESLTFSQRWQQPNRAGGTAEGEPYKDHSPLVNKRTTHPEIMPEAESYSSLALQNHTYRSKQESNLPSVRRPQDRETQSNRNSGTHDRLLLENCYSYVHKSIEKSE